MIFKFLLFLFLESNLHKVRKSIVKYWQADRKGASIIVPRLYSFDENPLTRNINAINAGINGGSKQCNLRLPGVLRKIRKPSISGEEVMKSAKISHGSNINYFWTSRHGRTDCIKVSLSWPPRWIPPVIRGHVAFKNGTRRALIFAFLPFFERRISRRKKSTSRIIVQYATQVSPLTYERSHLCEKPPLQDPGGNH